MCGFSSLPLLLEYLRGTKVVCGGPPGKPCAETIDIGLLLAPAVAPRLLLRALLYEGLEILEYGRSLVFDSMAQRAHVRRSVELCIQTGPRRFLPSLMPVELS